MRTPASIVLMVAALGSIPGSASADSLRTNISSVWANDGGDKVLQHERRGTANPKAVQNSVWDGSGIKLFGAKNEVVSFNLVLEANTTTAKNVTVSFQRLDGPSGSSIVTQPAPTTDGIFDWTKRPIELFFVRYLKIEGLSAVSYDNYDEHHVPKVMRLPVIGADGKGSGLWTDRPGADKFFPEIALPMELNPKFNIAPATNQSVWADIYIPRFAVPGLYKGTVSISEDGVVTKQIPVKLTVRKFKLPEEPSSKAMVYIDMLNVNGRYIGRPLPSLGSHSFDTSRKVRNRHFQMAHRHKIAVIDNNLGPEAWGYDRPRPDWMPVLDGTLFSPQNGYDGPGIYTSNGIFSIGTYGTWGWKDLDSEDAMHEHTDNWEGWFQRYMPNVERFLYLIDESKNFPETERWASWVKSGTGPGHSLLSLATFPSYPDALNVPSVDISVATMFVGVKDAWQQAHDQMVGSGRDTWMYNGHRPATGSFATEDDGTALRMIPWAQFKKGIGRWFFWESTYYNDYQSGGGTTNVWQKAQTLGSFQSRNPMTGKSGFQYSNGDGVLFYPGTDKMFPDDSYDVDGPIASLRLKHWRRGIQDIDYVTLANAIDPVKTQQIVASLVPSVLWENGVDDLNDPTYKHTDIGWSTNPEDWEAARSKLADIIESR